MLAEIHLNDGEKFQVLLVAFCLFLSALIVSLCLAINCCPLNKWLLDRDEKRRKRLQELAIHRQRSIARSHQITSQQSYYTNYHNSNNRFHNNTTNNNNKCAPQLANFIGPPPAYEAALHATRLQSLTSNSLVPDGGGGKTPSNQESGRQGHHDSPDWLKQALTSQQSECELANERPLDLGDYFHSPKEPFFGPADLYYNQQRPNHLAIPIYPMATNWCNNNTTYCTTTNGAPSATKPARLQAPVMLRLWVKLLEPDELIKRAREQTAQARSAQAESRPRRLSISRQLSIPQLFGSLLTLAGAKQQSGPGPTMAICDKDNNQSNQNQNEQDNNKHNEEESRVTINNSTTTDQQQQQLESTSSLSSLSSASSSSAAEPSSNSISTNTTSTTTTSSEQPDNSTTNSSTTTPKRAPPPKRPAELLPGGGRLPAATGGGSLVANTQRRCSLPTVRSITSRVLHMNVASFSYVKDENFISTKKHNQLNFHHFYSNKLAGSNSPSRKFAAAKGAKDNKMCQLLVSICDIENLLGASCLEERACLRLAQNSSVYVKCEILAPKSSGTKSAASRLLRNPLRVLTHQESSASLSSTTAGTHTIDFGPTIPATVIEPTRTATPRTAAAGSSPTSDIESARPAESSTADKPSSYSETPHTDTGAQEQFNSLASVSSDGDQEQQQDSQQQQQTRQHHNGSTTRPTVNWRHEPAADGKPIVVFNSIPKQIAQQQQLAFSSMVVTPQTTEASVNNNNSSSCNSIHGSPAMHSLESCTSTTGCGSHIQQQQPIDMIQFDSVFVSPILSKSLLENGHIRLRVYAQCKYVNETCLAELKLPLKQLMRTQSRDNLGDVGSGGTGNGPHQQADFILNNLLANLVTASTGSPLSTLIEQISAEEEREEAEAAGFRATATTNTRVQFARNRQLSDDNHTGTTTTTSGHSLGDHFRLATSWLGSATGGTARQTPQGSTTTAQLPRSSSSPNAAFTISSSSLSDKWPPHYNYLNGLEMDTSAMTNNSQADQLKQQQLNNNQEGDQVEGQQQHQQLMDDENNGGQLCSRQLIEQNYCRSLMVSHWLNYLVAPSYECQLVEEQRGKLVLGLTYLPTSNRLVFNAHRASIEPPNSGASLAGWDHKQLVKRLRMQSDTTYLLRFMMVANNRVIKRKQTACSRKPEWDSQEPVTFDLVNVNVEQPSFVVALVMRNPHSLASAGLGGGGSLQSLASYYQLRPCVPGGGGPQDRLDEGLADTDERWLSSGGGARRPGGPSGQQGLRGEPLGASSTCQSDPESLRLGRGGHASGIYRSGVELARRSPHELRPTTKAKRDLVVGHLVLADELWNELKAQPRKQLVKQFNLL